MPVLESVFAEEDFLQKTPSLTAAALDQGAVSGDSQDTNCETAAGSRNNGSSIGRLIEPYEQTVGLTIGSEIYRTLHRMSIRSAYSGYITNTTSSGQLSQYDATWNEALEQTMYSGYGNSASRNRDRLMRREGRERGPWLPQLKGIGRTGQGPAPGPLSMLRALDMEAGQSADTDAIPEQLAMEKVKLLDGDETLEQYHDEVVESVELDAEATCLDTINKNLRMEQCLKRLDVRTADHAENLVIEVELRKESLERQRVLELDETWAAGEGEKKEILDLDLEEDPYLKQDVVRDIYETLAPVPLFELDSVETCLVEIERILREQQHREGVTVIHPTISRPLPSELKRDIEERRLSLIAARPVTVEDQWEQWKQDDQAQVLARLATSLLNLYSDVGLVIPGNDEEGLVGLYQWLEDKGTTTEEAVKEVKASRHQKPKDVQNQKEACLDLSPSESSRLLGLWYRWVG